MIKSWTDDKGVVQYADEHSKAYRNRTEAESGKDADTVAEQTVEDVDKVEPKRRQQTVVKTPEAPAS